MMASNEKSTQADKELRFRRIYIATRLPEVRDEIKRLNDEKRQVLGKVKEASGTDLKDLNHRRIYATVRLDVLRTEQRALIEEKKTLAAKRASP
jgi:hypothetical protein